MPDNLKVAILLVLFNEEKHIERLCKSIINQSYKYITVYAIDNNSTDSSSSLLLKNLPDAIITKSKENFGFAKGNNILADMAINGGEELLFVLNTDMELDFDCITNLVDIFSKNPDIVGAGPIIYYGTDKGRTNNIQCYADKANFSNARTLTPYSGKDIFFEELPSTKSVNTLHGGCFMIRSSLVSEIGLFCEDNFMYNDEIDLAYRIYKIGGKLFVSKNAKAYHYHDWTKKNMIGYYMQYYYINRNRILFFYRYNKYFSLVREILKDILLLPVKIFWAKKTAGLKLLKYYYLGYLNGILNEKGKAKIEFK